MKILYHHRIASKDGQYVHIEEMTRALREMGHDLCIVGPPALEQARYGYDRKLISMLKRMIPGLVYEFMEFAYNGIAYRRLMRAINEFKPDVIYERYNLFFPCGIWAKKRRGIPLLLEVNAPLFHERSCYGGIALRRLARWSERYTWTQADCALPVTKVLAEHLTDAGVPLERIHVIPNGIDKKKFLNDISRADAKRRLELTGQIVLGFTGFVREWHGMDKVVDFIAQHKTMNLHLLLVGDGPARSALEERARTLQVTDRVTITGFVEREQVAAYIGAFDIALQPEVVDYASPLKLFEYLGAGCAILAPAKPNIMEILTDGTNALLFEARDQESMFNSLLRLCESEQLRAQLGCLARRTIEERELTWDGNARRVTAIAEELLS